MAGMSSSGKNGWKNVSRQINEHILLIFEHNLSILLTLLGLS